MSGIRYTDSLEGIRPEDLEGLHRGWPKPPSPATHLKSLRNMNAVMLAVEEDTGRVIGFVCGMTDETLILYVWDAEVRPEYHEQGVREELLRRLLAARGGLYQVNAVINGWDWPFWKQLGFTRDPNLVVGVTKMRRQWSDGGPRADAAIMR
ncbi:MAG: GNAT family N-acetyltransferase [Planctomycetota bacterium]